MSQNTTSIKDCILYLDDEENNLHAFKITVGSRYKVFLAENTKQVFEILKTNKIKVFFTDQRMPDTTGLELISLIKKLFPRIICIVITAYSETDTMLKAINHDGVYKYLLKPWDPTELIQTINNALNIYNLEDRNQNLIDELTQKNTELEAYNEELLSTTQALRDTQERLEIHNQELVVARLKAEESDNLKTAFIQNISHEIRTPMNGIVGFASLLTKPDLNIKTTEKYVDIIVKSCNKLLTVVENMLDIAKIETGNIEIVEDSCNINNIMGELHQKYQQAAQTKGLLFDFDSSLNANQAFIFTDESKINQILDNLINNAIKFTHNGYVKFSCEIVDNSICFLVEDSGIGIEAEMQAKVFDRFRQIENNETRQYEGAGLGLSIVKAYVEMLNGNIWMKSQVNKGSRFGFNIPYKPCFFDKPVESDLCNDDFVMPEMLVLIVEDDDFNYSFIDEVLSYHQISTIRAKTGLEAVEICEMSCVDLIFMDIRMPVLDGFEATKIIKAKYPSIPIIAQTAFINDTEMATRDTSLFDGYLPKPITKNDVIATVYKYLNTKNQDLFCEADLDVS